MISMQIINSNGGAMELACMESSGIEIAGVMEPSLQNVEKIAGVMEPSLQNVETARANFPSLDIRHCYIGTELAADLPQTDVIYVNVAKREYTAKESAVPVIDRNIAGPESNGSLVMKNAFRLIALKEPEMFVVESGLRLHTAATEAFAAIPGYYIRQLVIKDARACGYPMKKQKSFSPCPLARKGRRIPGTPRIRKEPHVRADKVKAVRHHRPRRRQCRPQYHGPVRKGRLCHPVKGRCPDPALYQPGDRQVLRFS